MFFRFIKTFERMVLFYGRQLNGTIRASLWSGQRRIANSGVIAHFNQEYVKTGVLRRGHQKLSAMRRSCVNRRTMRTSMRQHRKRLLMCLCRHLNLFQRWNAIFTASRFSNRCLPFGLLQVDDGYRAIYLYYQRDNLAYPIEVQLWCCKDYYFNLWSHQYVYKYKSPEIGRQLYLEYAAGEVKTEREFQKRLRAGVPEAVARIGGD